MTGAGSLIAGNYIYNRAKPDGLTIGVWNSAWVLKEALGERGVKFKGEKFGWIGAPSVGLPGCAIMAFSGLRTLKDIQNAKNPIKMGATRSGSPSDLPKILNRVLGTNFDVIPGYRGTATIRIAMQKREVDGACWSWESMRVTAKSMLEAKGDDKLIPFITYGNPQDPEVKDLPQLNEVVKGRENLAMLNAWLQQYNFARPLSVPPGTPKKRIKILRKALKAVLRDPQLLAEAKKSKLIMTYVSGEQTEKYVEQILAMSAKTKESLQFLVVRKKKK